MADCCGQKRKPLQLPERQSDLRVTTANTFVDKRPKTEIFEAKVILLGDSGVGKSSIAQRYCHNTFSDSHDVTIGAAYLQQTVVLPDDQQVKLHIWDTGGSERFRTMVSLYYRDAAAAIICYDVTDETSFESVNYWVGEMERNAGENFVMALAGNKIDSVTSGNARAVPLEMSRKVARQHNMVHEDTSAKTGQGIVELFGELAQRISD